MAHRTPRTLALQDPEIAAAIEAEAERQHAGLEMIASENFVSEAVLEAAGSVLTNKYAEGYPGKRYYGGCEFADVVEDLARERARRLFGASYVNVQPHSGSQANAAVMMALLEPGDGILGLDLAHGGHLTHGHRLNFSGKLYRVASYGVSRETETIDYHELLRVAEREQPKLLIAGGSAYPRIWEWARMRAIADAVGAKLLVDMAHIAGLVAGGVHPSPLPWADVVTTTTHKTLRGPRAGMILAGWSGRAAHDAAGKGADGHGFPTTGGNGANGGAGNASTGNGRGREFADADGGKAARVSEAAAVAELGKKLDRCVFPGQQGGPLMHVIAAKAVAFGEALDPSFRAYSEQVVRNAQALAEGLVERGLRLISGGTDTHLVLVDVWAKGMGGAEAETALGGAGLTVNKNAIPWDTQPPMRPSGVRLGTPALTTRGMGEREMRVIAGWVADVVDGHGEQAVVERVKGAVEELCEGFPLYAERRAAARESVTP